MLTNLINLFALVAGLALVAGILAFIPWVIIWAINTLFATTIVFNFWTWLAVMVLITVIGSFKSKSK